MQQQAAAGVPGLNGAGLNNLSAVAGAGALEQQQAQNYTNAAQQMWNYNQQLPYSNLGTYMNTINSLAHGGTTTNQQPVFSNTSGQIAGGVTAGLGLLSALGAFSGSGS